MCLAFYFVCISRIMLRDVEPVPSAPPDEEGLNAPMTTYHAAPEPPPVDPSDGFSRNFHGGLDNHQLSPDWISKVAPLPASHDSL